MKRVYVAMAVCATAALISCQQEKSFDGMTLVGENGIAFKIDGMASTRSAEIAPVAKNGVTIPIDIAESGESFYLKETITELNPSPATKGAPAYTVNVGELFPEMGVYAAGNFGDVTFMKMDMYENPNGGDGWRYHHNYTSNPWPSDEKTPVDFYLRMPATPAGLTEAGFKHENSKVTFTLQSPGTGSAQEDILFAHTAISKKEHDGYLPNGAPVMMYHALSGVKFRTGNNNDNQTKTIITKVELLGLIDKGTCTYDPAGSKMFTWSDTTRVIGSFSQAFNSYEYDEDSDNTVDYIKKGEGANDFGDSWYKPGNNTNQPFNTKNLNDDEGSMTFWFIPQEITGNLKIKVHFKVLTPDTQIVEEITHTINIGETLKGVKWEAGQLRTYTLEPTDVDVEIFDTMTETTDTLAKSGLHVTNTGNVDEYIRMLVIGNWYGWTKQADYDAYLAGDLTHEPNILVGYTTDGSDGTNEMVSPWFRGDDVWGSYFDETFKKGNPTNEKWVKAAGGYYYTDKIGPGDQMSTLESGTQPLFQYYHLPKNKVPTIYVPVSTSNVRQPAVGVHLVMEIVVQAIGTKKADGTEFADWKEAWSTTAGIQFTE